jgi:phage-related protein
VAAKRRKASEADEEVEARQPYDDWVWWPNQKGRRGRAEEEFAKFPAPVQGEFLSSILRHLQGIGRFKDVKELRSGLKELRVRKDKVQYRVVFFIDGRVCVGVTCFHKDQQKTPEIDLNRAIERMKSYRSS